MSGYPEFDPIFAWGCHWKSDCRDEWLAQTACLSKAEKLASKWKPFSKTKPKDKYKMCEQRWNFDKGDYFA